MALHKTQNSLIDLTSDGNNNDDNGEMAIDLISGDHGKKFAAKIKKIVGEKPAARASAEKLETEERTARKKPAAAGAEIGKIDPAEDKNVTDLRFLPRSTAADSGGVRESAGPKPDFSGDKDHPREAFTGLSRDTAAPNITEENPEAKAETPAVSAPSGIKSKFARLEFPRGFLWGTATSAYQTEGGIENDWSHWEKSMKRLQYLMKKNKPSIDYICGRACDSYNRFKEDLDLARGLNNNAIRFGLEWARIQPKKDTIDVEALNHYREVLREAKKRGLKTVVTLWHWTNPPWLARENGWENKNSVKHFASYADLVVKELGADIDYWVTINEPNMYVFGAYLHNQFPPQKWSIHLAIKAFLNLTKAHNRAYRIIHRHFPRARVGFTGLFNHIEPANGWNPVAIGLAAFLHYFWNDWLLRRTKGYFDFIGANYYFHDRIVAYPPFKMNRNEWVNDKGWEIYPKGIYCILKYLSKYRKPILITENGVADAEDRHREKFIERHLYWTHKAIEEGVDVRGYFHWSLLDNFEWADGWAPKFGLYALDRKTFARQARPSAAYYADICRKNRVKIRT